MSVESPDLPIAILHRVVEVLRGHGVDEFAFTGGVAVGVWAEPRQTRDIDVCGRLPLEEVERLLVLRDGVRFGPSEMPDLVRFRVGDWDVDLFVTKDAHDRSCLDRAVRVRLEDLELRVVTAEDLLIHKMIKLRSDKRRLLQDLADIRAVVAAQTDRLDWSYVRRCLGAAEADLLESVALTGEEDLVRRFLG